MSSAALIDTPNLPAKVRKARISANVKAAIGLMVNEGRSRADAAKACGITDDWLYRALERPECRSYRNHLMQVLRESEASRTIFRAAKLADGAESEHVKLQANSWLAGLEGISPVSKSENVNITKSLTPGLTVNFFMNGAPGDDAHVLSEHARQLGSSQQINGLPQRVPHPSEGNVLPAPNPPGNHEGQE